MNEPITITSRDNPRLVRIRKVRDGKINDEIFIEGRRLAAEALQARCEIVECVISEELSSTDAGREIIERSLAQGTPVVMVSGRLFKSIADTVHTQGIVLILKRPITGRDAVASSPEAAGLKIFVYLHEANDPSNIGAVMRTAEAAGAAGVILSNNSADAFSPKALRAGMGANLRVPIWDRADLGEVLEWARESRLRVLATDAEAKLSCYDVDWREPSLLIFGSEAHGLDQTVAEKADDVIRIPMKNGVESLNLAVSAAIVLFEGVRQNS